MGSLGVPEMIAIFLLALVLFGPKKLPEIGKTIGKAIGEFRRASSELKETFNKEIQNIERETESIKEAASPYQYDTYNYDYSSYEAPNSGDPVPEIDNNAADPSSESASAPQGAELPPVGTPEGSIAHGSETDTEFAAIAGVESEPVPPAEGQASDSAAAPTEHKA